MMDDDELAAMSELSEAKAKMMDALEWFWIVLANVNVGDWTKQNADWQQAAAQARDKYHAILASSGPKVKP